MSNVKIHRSFAALHLPSPASALLTYARGVVTAMTGNPWFPSTVPTLPTVTAATDALDTAQTAALSRTRGNVAIRDEKKAELVTLLHQLKNNVQTVADANVENATSIIESAGMAVRRTNVRKPRDFGVEAGKVSGSVDLFAANAGKRAAYEWESSADGGKTWVTLPVTLQARTTVGGLAPGASVWFRGRPVSKSGEGDWSQPVSFLVT